MSDKTGIEWCDSTWNPVRGCSRVSEGCRNCYAERVAARFSGPGKPYDGLIAHGGQWNGTVRLVPEQLDQPLRWRKPRRIFVNSMSDLFHESVPVKFIDEVFSVMALAGRHTFQVLTKRPARMLAYMQSRARSVEHWEAAARGMGYTFRWTDPDGNGHSTCPFPPRNVWLGVSVEDQATADERIPLLLQTPAAVRWISAEPLLGPIDLERVLWPDKGGHRVDVLRGGYWNAAGYRYGGPSAELGAPKGGFTNHSDIKDTLLNWVVVGGESGPGARPMEISWARSLVQQCKDADVPVLVKQLGAQPRGWCVSALQWDGESADLIHDDFCDIHEASEGPYCGARCYFMRSTKGGDMDEWPEDLRVREYPRAAP